MLLRGFSAFSREQLPQILCPQDPSPFQGMSNFGIGMMALEQHWLASFSFRFSD
jgi:hypothetical protein